MREIRDLATGMRPDETIHPSMVTDRRTQADVLVNGVRRTWRDAFVNGIDTRVWDVITAGNGAVTSTRNSATLTAGTETTDVAALISKDTFTAPFRFSALMSISARNANQNIYVEMVSVGPDGQIDEQNIIGWLFDGTIATQGKHRVSNAEANELVSAASTISTTASAAHFEFELMTDEARFYTQAVDSTSGKNATFRRTRRLPDPAARYKLRIRTENTGVTTTADVVLNHIACEMFMEVPVELTGAMNGAGNAFGLQVWNTSALLVGGVAARNSANSGNPLYVATGVSANPTAVTTGRNVDLISTLIGALIVKPYGIPELDWRAALALTTATSTAVKAAAAAGIRNYVTAIQVTNNSATTTLLSILDGATVIWTVNVPAGGQIVVQFPTPLRGTAATAMNVQAGTAVTTLHVNVQGYEAP